MTILTRQEKKILKFILKRPRTLNNSVGMGSLTKDTCPENISEKELIRELNILEQNNLIEIKWKARNHNTLSNTIDIIILPDGDSYFKIKRRESGKIAWELLKWSVPLVVSIISLCVSIFAVLMKLE